MGEIFDGNEYNIVVDIYSGDSQYANLVLECVSDYDAALERFREYDENLERMYLDFLKEENIAVEELDDTSDFIYLTLESPIEYVLESAAVHGMDVNYPEINNLGFHESFFGK